MKHITSSFSSVLRRGALLIAVVFSWASFVGGLQPDVVLANSSNTCSGGNCKIYLPAVVKPSSATGDLAITGIEVTQGIQNTQNDVPLVAGRKTVVRIYTSATSTLQTASTVKVSFTPSGSNLSLSDGPKTITSAIPSSSSRASYGSSINYELPANWVSGSMDLTIKLDADNQVNEVNESNNSYTQHLSFTSVPALNVMIVPIQYSDPRTNHIYPAPSQDTVSEWIRKVYPISQVNISWHAPVSFNLDLSNSSNFVELLNRVTALKTSEQRPDSLVYFGLIPTADGSTHWFNGGTAGIGWIGFRAAVGLDLSGQTSQIAAHEIGHNLGLWHAPCGGASDPDQSFPYAGGTIGQYGVDTATGQIYAPSTYDMMSYCNPKWISDYNYKLLLTSQVKASNSLALASVDPRVAQAKRQLLVRANLYADRTEMLPVYVLPDPATRNPTAGDYQVQVLGANDEVLTQIPVSAYASGEEELPVQTINTLVPLPAEPAMKVRLLKGDVVLAEQTLQTVTTEGEPEISTRAADQGTAVQWTASDQPALLRYSSDGGATWTTLGIDLPGSELAIPATTDLQPDGIYQVIQAGIWK